MRPKVLFLSDLDGTWLGKERALLDQGMDSLKDEYREKGIDLEFGYVTARPPERLDKNLPQPDYKITFNGARVEDRDGELNDWLELNERSRFDKEEVREELDELLEEEPEFQGLSYQTVGQVVGNPASDASRYFTSFCFPLGSLTLEPQERADRDHDGVPDILEKSHYEVPAQIADLANELTDELEDEGMGFRVNSPYIFHGKPFIKMDITAPEATKGEAVSFLAEREHVRPDHLIVACDGGNDVSMVELNGDDDGRRTIVVGHEHNLREAGSARKNGIVRPENEDSSRGVYLGLRQHLDAIVADLER